MDVENDQPENELESREPSVEDLVALCGELNARRARYVVAGGWRSADSLCIARFAVADEADYASGEGQAGPFIFAAVDRRGWRECS